MNRLINCFSRNLVKVFLLLLSTITLVACEKERQSQLLEVSTLRKISVNEFPSTDMYELQYKQELTEDVVCPIVARIAVMYELYNGGYNLLCDLRNGTNNETHVTVDDIESIEWNLTDLPRAIYDYDGTIRYYEFGLVEDGEITATITAYARREAPGAIAYMFPYILPYNSVECDYYVGQYPHRVFYDGANFCYVSNPEIMYNSEENNNDEYWLQIYERASIEQQEELDILRNNMTLQDEEYTEKSTLFWSSVDDVILTTSYRLDIEDPCVMSVSPAIVNEYIKSLKDYLGTNEYCRDYTARPYCGTSLQQTFWEGACGPSALAWVYRGLRTTYPWNNGVYLPLRGEAVSNLSNYIFYSNAMSYDSNPAGVDTLDGICFVEAKSRYIERSYEIDNGLTAIFYNLSIPIKTKGVWQFMLLPSLLNNAFRDATEDVFGVSADKDAQYAADWILNYNLPTLILERDLSHYLVAYGFGGTTNEWGGEIERENLYFLVTDNSHETGNYNYKPFWRRYQKLEYYHCVEWINI